MAYRDSRGVTSCYPASEYVFMCVDLVAGIVTYDLDAMVARGSGAGDACVQVTNLNQLDLIEMCSVLICANLYNSTDSCCTL